MAFDMNAGVTGGRRIGSDQSQLIAPAGKTHHQIVNNNCDQREDEADMQPGSPEHGQRLGVCKYRRTRHVEAFRIFPGTEYDIIERQQCHIVQHQ
ncbi:hypothetical protein D3C71_1414600 [compost metagenome]